MSTPGAQSSQPSKRRPILIVDDDTSLRSQMARALEDAGYRVSSVADESAALRHLQQGDLDLVITDLCMPGVDGGELVMGMRRIAPELPLIALSGSFAAMSDPLVQVLRLFGASRTVEKPFPMRVLLAAVQDVLGQVTSTSSCTGDLSPGRS